MHNPSYRIAYPQLKSVQAQLGEGFCPPVVFEFSTFYHWKVLISGQGETDGWVDGKKDLQTYGKSLLCSTGHCSKTIHVRDDHTVLWWNVPMDQPMNRPTNIAMDTWADRPMDQCLSHHPYFSNVCQTKNSVTQPRVLKCLFHHPEFSDVCYTTQNSPMSVTQLTTDDTGHTN